MRTSTVVTAEVRETRGKNAANRTRAVGKIPAVAYGAFKEAVSLAVSPKDILQVLRSKTGHNTIFDLDIQGVEQTPVMIVDEQYDPVKGNLLHVDLKRIDLSKRIRVSVPVTTSGEAKGIKLQGGLLEVVTRQVEIECVPDSIPAQYVVDVTELIIGQSKRAGDIALGEGVRLVSSPDTVVAHVVGVRAVEEVAAPAAEPAAAEPEVAKKGKKEDEAATPAGLPEKGKKK